MAVEVHCGVCSKQFSVTNTRFAKCKSGLFFCSREHLTDAIHTGQISTGPKSSSRLRCSVCGKRARREASLCMACKKSDQIARWLSGDLSATYGLQNGEIADTLPFVKAYLIELRGDSCEDCGFNKRRPDGGSIIQMDHIDGNPYNNLIENLRLLCPNCHAMTPTYGARNRGSGRTHRRRGETDRDRTGENQAHNLAQ